MSSPPRCRYRVVDVPRCGSRRTDGTTLLPPAQYADDRNLRARQRLWEHQQPPFDVVGWAIDIAGVNAGQLRERLH